LTSGSRANGRWSRAPGRASDGQGIGRATALLLGEAGARVGCMDLDEARRAAIVREVEAAGA